MSLLRQMPNKRDVNPQWLTAERTWGLMPGAKVGCEEF